MLSIEPLDVPCDLILSVTAPVDVPSVITSLFAALSCAQSNVKSDSVPSGSLGMLHGVKSSIASSSSLYDMSSLYELSSTIIMRITSTASLTSSLSHVHRNLQSQMSLDRQSRDYFWNFKKIIDCYKE